MPWIVENGNIPGCPAGTQVDVKSNAALGTTVVQKPGVGVMATFAEGTVVETPDEGRRMTIRNDRDSLWIHLKAAPDAPTPGGPVPGAVAEGPAAAVVVGPAVQGAWAPTNASPGMATEDAVRLLAGLIAAAIFAFAGLQLIGIRSEGGNTIMEASYQGMGIMSFALAALSVALAMPAGRRG